MDPTKIIDALRDSVEKVFVGRREVVDHALIALFSSGHLLIDDLPGVGKTTLAKAIAYSIGGDSKRVQFTPDLLPTDITGVNIYVYEKNTFDFHPGPVFTNVLLADEINRATPRAQSSLLEAMEELQVSVEGKIYPLAPPFMVIATQNPIEIQGTFPLPEAQLDRFMISLSIGYPSHEDEMKILEDRTESEPIQNIAPVLGLDQIELVKNQARSVKLDDTIKSYIIEISEATRQRDDILIGASPRASLALMNTARTRAMMSGRNFVTPEDVREMAPGTLAHRLILRHATRLNIERNRAMVEAVLGDVPVPRPR